METCSAQCRPLPLPQILERLGCLVMWEGSKQRHDCQSGVKKLGKYFSIFRDLLTAEREISDSSVLATSTLLMVNEAIPSRNRCRFLVFLRSGDSWVFYALFLLPILVQSSSSLLFQKHPRMYSCEKNSRRTWSLLRQIRRLFLNMIHISGGGHPLMYYILLIDNKRKKDRKYTFH